MFKSDFVTLILGQASLNIFNVCSDINGVRIEIDDLTVLYRRELRGITTMNIWKVELDFDEVNNIFTKDDSKNHGKSEMMNNTMLKLNKYFNDDEALKDGYLHIFIVSGGKYLPVKEMEERHKEIYKTLSSWQKRKYDEFADENLREVYVETIREEREKSVCTF
ncbi:hypothetical protein GLOIN_2v1808787 [Rhizophagus clarus]|uniref:Uncharacterized protein n=1 Tax=Rhizophagus clarus TaxID=94130 RepID=A0A8H3LBE7_9GLOM|nr:hypothetical protein GLOIN_2v1808787 [Rhizophagus clarus]